MKALTPTRLSNKQLIESAFKAIEKETGYHIIDKKFGNTYFVIEDEDNSICHFHIREIPGFIFAFWNTCRFDTIQYQLDKNGIGYTWADSLGVNPRSELVFFTQYERDMDKFKPARSGFVTGIYRDVHYAAPNGKSLKRVQEWIMYDLIDILKFMHNHPIKSYHYVQSCVSSVWDEISNFKALKIFINDWIDDKKHKLKHYIKHQLEINAVKNMLEKLQEMNYLVIDDELCSPRITVNLRHTKQSNNIIYKHDCEIIDAFMDKWFNRITIQQWEMDISQELNKDEKLEDKKLGTRYKRLNEYHTSGKSKCNVLFQKYNKN